MDKDYYKILGVLESDSQENIKTAYRKLAAKWHPDVAGNSPEILTRFKEINEAYSVLSNRIKKAEYDKARKFYNYAKMGSNSSNNKTNNEKNKETSETYNTNPNKKGFSFSWEDFGFIKQDKTQPKQKNTPQKGDDVLTDLEITVLEAIQGTSKVINMLHTSTCPKCNGRKFINGNLCTHCGGKGEVTNYKKFTVKIPAGIKNNSKIRLVGEGSLGINGGANGDLYITVHIVENKDFQTDGINILKNIEITPFEAVLGCEAKISTFTGDYLVKIAPYTKNGQKIRLSGCGIVQNKKVGDMIITVSIQIPKNLTDEEISLYKKLKELSTGNIRDLNDR